MNIKIYFLAKKEYTRSLDEMRKIVAHKSLRIAITVTYVVN